MGVWIEYKLGNSKILKVESNKEPKKEVTLEGKILEKVDKFNYLGKITINSKIQEETRQGCGRIATFTTW